MFYQMVVKWRIVKPSATVLNDTYTGHENEKGHYIYQVKYVDQETNEEIIKAFQINVTNDTYVVSKVDEVTRIYSTTEIGILAAMTITFIAVAIIMIEKGKKLKNLKSHFERFGTFLIILKLSLLCTYMCTRFLGSK